MLNKLKSFFPRAISTENPYSFSIHKYYWFRDVGQSPLWLGIPKTDVKVEQYELLATLFERLDTEQSLHLSDSSKEWYAYLFQESHLPAIHNPIRYIQLQIENTVPLMKEMDEAIKEFFCDNLAFFWLDERNAIIVEERNENYFEESDLESISTTLENDFYVRAFFYLGKFRDEPKILREAFYLEQELFRKIHKGLYQERVFLFENIIPTIVAKDLPDEISALLLNDICSNLKEDPELLRTIEVFLENNSNVSLAAKNLYIHRNTLQYRLDKFTEQTGINLKSFHHLFTVYLACQLTKAMENRKDA